MSESSYQENTKRGVTGLLSGTCLLASYDRFSERTGIKPQTYKLYDELVSRFFNADDNASDYALAEITKEFFDIQSVFCRDLGVQTSRNIYSERVDTEEALYQTLGRLASGGFRTAAYLDISSRIDGKHAVGVQSVGGDRYFVKSTWSPFPDETASLHDIFIYLDRCPRTRKRENNGRRTTREPNIIALPPER